MSETVDAAGNALKIDSGFLRRRFWLSALLVFVPLSVATALSVLSLLQNIDNNHYSAAFGKLGIEIARLEGALASAANRGSLPQETADQHIAEARHAFNSLLTAYVAIRASDPDGEGLLTDDANRLIRGALRMLMNRHGIDPPAASAALHLDQRRMPEALEDIWEAGTWNYADPGASTLEFQVAQLLLAAAPVFDTGKPSLPLIRTTAYQVHRLIEGHLRGNLVTMEAALQAITLRSATLPVVLLATIFLLVVAAQAFSVFTVFRPLETAVLAAQTDLVRERQNALAAEHAKSEFLATMSHEIRTPLNGILGMAELLETTTLDQRQGMFTETIRKSGHVLLAVINDILDFSKIDSGHLNIDPRPFPLAAMINDPARLVARAAARKGLELAVRLEPGLPGSVSGDVGRIQQVVTNLLSNAIKFTDRGQVVVDLSADAGPHAADDAVVRLRVEVRDSGPGIVPAKLGTIFEKFTQVDSSASRRHEGTGLGLAIAKGLVELMGGQIGAISTPGKGSTFWFTLSLPVASEETTVPRPPVKIAGRRVLIVDDNATNRCILQELMAAWGLDGITAASGHEGISRLIAEARRGRPLDLVILDHHMPDMTGEDVVQAMRANPEVAAVPVILLTSIEQLCTHETLAEFGIQGYLVKPASASDLFETVVAVLSKCAAVGAAPAADPALAGSGGEEDDFAGSGDGVDVLLVEDNHVNGIVAGQILLHLGLNHVLAEDGELAVARFAEIHPRLILMDVSMPRQNGYEATGRIRAMEAADRMARTPIIGLTAHALQGDREKCLAAGMDDYLAKPVSTEALGAMIVKWCPDLARPAQKGPERTMHDRRHGTGAAALRAAAE